MVEFKKVVICCMPSYESIDYLSYFDKLVIVLNEVLGQAKEFMFVFNQTSGQNTIPNQIVISLFLKYLEQNTQKERINIKLVSEDKNICSLFRLEIMKGSIKNK
jgi:hypothetical protein